MSTYPLPNQLPEGCDVGAYYARKAAELKDLQVGPVKTLEITLPLPIAEHLIETAAIYGKSVDDFILTWIYASYRTPEEKAESKRQIEESNQIHNWQPMQFSMTARSSE